MGSKCVCVCILNKSVYKWVLSDWTNSDHSGGPFGTKNARADFFCPSPALRLHQATAHITVGRNGGL